MADNPKIDRYERMLLAMPSDFRGLATWAWTELQPMLRQHAIACGATPELATSMAARLARLVVFQMYGDIKRSLTIQNYRG